MIRDPKSYEEHLAACDGVHVGQSVCLTEEWLTRLHVGGVGPDYTKRWNGPGTIMGIVRHVEGYWTSVRVLFPNGVEYAASPENLRPARPEETAP